MAYQGVSGLARTVRGPSMSATPGKVCVDGVTEVAGVRAFVLHMIQAREPQLVGALSCLAIKEGKRAAEPADATKTETVTRA